jgi:hypothetical protein
MRRQQHVKTLARQQLLDKRQKSGGGRAQARAAVKFADEA